jgi:hypothetical protein
MVMTLSRVLFTMSAVVGISQCSHPNVKTKPPVSEASVSEKSSKKIAPVLPAEVCQSFRNPEAAIPHHINKATVNAVITRLTKPCVTRDGQRGFEKDTAWMAMGIPCSGGQGVIDISGKSYNPKMLSFMMSTDCRMKPADVRDLQSAVAEDLGLGSEQSLLAYNPLAVQYWESPSSSDADTGERIDIRGSDENLRSLWNDFKAGTRHIEVTIYGRENAWVEDDQVYRVVGDIKFQAPIHFVFEPKRVNMMTRDEIKELSERCSANKTRKNCGDLF